jgi:5-methyltetrahydrofolate--homocysteine methyltransferase
MRTRVTGATKEVIIAHDLPTVLIGERINPTGKKKLAAALQAGDLERVRQEAIAQVRAGADILDVNVGVPGLNEEELLPRAVQAVMEVVDVPLCLDSDNPKALAAALRVCKGKPIINSVNGQERRLDEVLPLVKQYGAAVIGLTMDDQGIPKDVETRVAIAHKIAQRVEAAGIPREDLIMDCLCLTVATDTQSALVTFETMRRVRDELGVNQTLGASNISFGLPDREVINGIFLALAIAHGLTCPNVDVAKVRAAVTAADLLLGRDNYAMRYIRAFRARQVALQPPAASGA